MSAEVAPPETAERGPNESGTGEGGIVERLVEFGHALRAHDLPVGPADVLNFCEAANELSVGDPVDLYWAGRSTLVHRRDHLPVYDEVFRQFFLGIAPPKKNEETAEKPVPQGQTGVLDVPDSEGGEEQGDDQPLVLGLQASGVEVERNKRFDACTEEELAAVRRIIKRTRLQPPLRQTRRRAPDPKGRTFDIRRMTREAMRLSQDRGELRMMSRKVRPRPIILLLDISGSMADHSRNLLQFAYSMNRAAQKVEVFCFGTTLTRITPALNRRSPDDALRLAAERVFDWDGGTRIGASLDEFVRTYARRGMSRGATVVICSDGLDRGNPILLSEALERLARLSHRIVWMNPLFADATHGTPNTLAMAIAAPHLDAVETGHDLASLESFAVRLAEIG